MFIWPDSIPDPVFYVFFGLFPLSFLAIDRYPLFFTAQSVSLVLVGSIAIAVLVKARWHISLRLLVAGGLYVLTIFLSNLALAYFAK